MNFRLQSETKLKLWANPNASAKIKWKQDPDKTIKVEEPWAHVIIGEKGFEGELSRFGHGMQRSYLLTLLQELANSNDNEVNPILVMGIEEPELYQHPPQARYLSELLQSLSKKDSQILVCSHSPYFIPGDDFSSVRIVRELGKPSYTTISQLSYHELTKKLNEVGEKPLKESGVIAKLYPTLRPEINEMFFCSRLILVEGIEDVAYISTYLELCECMNDFRRTGCHIVPVGGKSELIRPICIAQMLEIPIYVACDADTNKEDKTEIAKLEASEEEVDKNKLKKIIDEITKHKKDNKAILQLMGCGDHSNWPATDVWMTAMTMWKTNITQTIETEMGADWKSHEEKASSFYGKAAGLKKNPLAVSKALESAWKAGLKSTSLIKLVHCIVGKDSA